MTDQPYEVIEYKGRELTLPLSDENRAFLYSRGKDPLVAELDHQWANIEFRRQQLAELGVENDATPDFDTDELDDAPPYEQWKKDELVAEAKERDLDSNGTKDELVARLYEDDATE